MHRFDASEQYFTRAVDFGYSFSIEETLEKWGRDEITRRLRAPDSHDAPRCHPRHEPDRHRRRAAPPDVGTAQPGSVQSRRRSARVSGTDSRRPACRGSRASTTTRGRPGGGGRGQGAPATAAAAARRTEGRGVRCLAASIRCSAARTSRSAPKSGACTRARRWRSCSRCRRVERSSATADGLVVPAPSTPWRRIVALRWHRHDDSRSRVVRRRQRRRPRWSQGCARSPITSPPRRSSSISSGPFAAAPSILAGLECRAGAAPAARRRWGCPTMRGSTSMRG